MVKFELKKFFSQMTNKVILTALLLVTVIVSFMAVDSVRYTDTDGKEPAGIGKITAGRKLAADKNKWKGELTPEKIADIAESYHEIMQRYQGDYPATEYGRTVQSYWDIVWFASKMYTTDLVGALADMNRLAEKDLAYVYDAYADNLQDMTKEYGKTPEQEKFLKEQYQKIEMPVTYEAYDSWENMATHVETCILILVVVIGFLAVGIFDEEFRNHAELVFFTTKYGRSKAVRSKIAVGLLTTTIIYWAGIGILSLISFGIMGVSGFDTPYQFAYPYSFYVITQGQHYFMVVAGGYIACLLSASVTMLVTAKMHTVKVAVCIPFFIYIVLLFMERPISKFTNVVYFTPNILVNIENQLKHPHIFQIGNVVFRQIPFVMIVYVAVSIILLPFIYRSYCRYDSAKNPHRGSRERNGTKHN